MRSSKFTVAFISYIRPVFVYLLCNGQKYQSVIKMWYLTQLSSAKPNSQLSQTQLGINNENTSLMAIL